MRRRRGRPLGEIAIAFIHSVYTLPRPTVSAVAADLKLPLPRARSVASQLTRGGWCCWSAEIEPTATRPARVLQVAQPAAAPEPRASGDDLVAVMGMMIRSGKGRP